jgi:hypothetical protein
MQTGPLQVDPYLQNELKPGEQLLWWGRPDPAHRVKSTGTVNTNYIIYGALAIAMVFLLFFDIHLINEESTDFSSPDPLTIGLLIISIILLSVYMYRIYMLYSATQKSTRNLRNTIYGITNRRIIVMTLVGQNFAVKSHTQSDIGQITRTETGGGWGDVGYGVPRAMQVGMRATTIVDKLAGVPGARLVEDILIRTFKNVNAVPQQIWYSQPSVEPYPPSPQQYIQPPQLPSLPQD